jgi:LemA protein
MAVRYVSQAVASPSARCSRATVSGATKALPSDPEAMKKLSGSENQLTQALGRLFAVSEAYPDLKANQNMMQLSEELTSTENRVAFSRQAYNDSVMNYNNKVQVFPSTLIAGPFGFSPAQQLEIDDPAKREAPKVSFS